MIRAILYALGGLILTAVVFALLAPILFQGANMQKVGEMLGAPIALAGGAIGFVTGLLLSRKKKNKTEANKAEMATPRKPSD